jgi:WD40 repeat protein
VVSNGHHQNVTSLDFSADGRYIVSGGYDNLLKIYDLRLQQELNTINAHSGAVLQVKFSSDDKYIVSLAAKEMFIHTHPTGEMVHRIEFEHFMNESEFYLTKDGKILLGNDWDGIQIFDLATGKLEKNLSVKSYEFGVLSDENTLVLQYTNDAGVTGLQFYSISEDSFLSFIERPQSYMDRIEVSPKGDVLAWEYALGTLALIDTRTLKILNEFKIGGIGSVNAMQFTPDGKSLLLTDQNTTMTEWEVATGKKTREIKDLTPSGEPESLSMAMRAIDFSNDGKTVAVGYVDLRDRKTYYTVEWFEAKTMKSIGRHFGDVSITPSIAIDKSGTMLCTGTLGSEIGVKFMDVVGGTQKMYVQGSAYFAGALDKICTATMRGDSVRLEVFESPSMKLVQSIRLEGFAQLVISQDARYVAAIDQKYNPKAKPGEEMVVPYVRVWEIETGKEVVHIRSSIMDGLRQIYFSVDASALYLIYDTKIERASIETGKIAHTASTKISALYKVCLSPDGAKIYYPDVDNVLAVDPTSGEVDTLLHEDMVLCTSVAVSPDKRFIAAGVYAAGQRHPHRVRLFDAQTKKLLCEYMGHTAYVRSVVIDYDSRHIYSADDNGVIAMWDLEDCLLKSSFLAFGAEDYMIINPEGFYKSSKNNIANIGFRLKGQLYTFDQFDLRYNRPDKVLQSIGMASESQVALYEKAYQKRLRRMGFTEADFTANISAPEIQIVGLESLPLQVSDEQIVLSYKATDGNSNLDRLQVLVNDVPVFGKLGIDLKGKESKSLEDKVTIPLAQGLNRIQLTVLNQQGIESARQSYLVDCKKANAQSELYVLAYGVKSFADSSMNLTYSDKDAEDFTKLLQSVAGTGKYAKVHVRLLKNEQVLKESLAESHNFLQQTKIDDQVILFFSGHGLLSEDMDYFLSTYDVDFAQPQVRGMAFNDFQDLLDGIPARNRLLLVDACHSGEVDKDEVAHAPAAEVAEVHEKSFAAKGKKVIGLGSSFELMKDLFVELKKEVGATVIASSSGKEFSLESAEWKNGVFTYALKEALSQKKADFNADGKVQVSELKKFLAVRVKELTNGRQVPTARTENLQIDNVIY